MTESATAGDLVSWFEAHAAEEVSDWFAVTQDVIDAFAALTGDHQWIHVDPDRAAVESPFGGTVAHGFLVMSLVTRLFDGLPPGVPATRAINYGVDRLRFAAPVRAGVRIRGRRRIRAVTRLPANGAKVVTAFTIEAEGETKPACVFDSIVLFFP